MPVIHDVGPRNFQELLQRLGSNGGVYVVLVVALNATKHGVVEHIAVGTVLVGLNEFVGALKVQATGDRGGADEGRLSVPPTLSKERK